MAVQFRKITIVGVGLLGGSIGLAARQRRLAGEVAGYVRRAIETAGLKLSQLEDLSTRNEDHAPVPGLVVVARKS